MPSTSRYSWWRPSRSRIAWTVQWYVMHWMLLAGVVIGSFILHRTLPPNMAGAVELLHMFYGTTAVIIWLIDPPGTFYKAFCEKFNIGRNGA